MIKRILIYILLTIFALFFLMPIYVLLATSLKPLREVGLERMWFPPNSFSFDGFAKAFARLAPNLRNSFLLVIPATLLSAIIGSINGYVLSKLKFRGSDLLFALVLFGMFIPYQSILFPLIRFLQDIGLYGSIWGLVLVHVVYGLPITTLIFRNYYSEVPTELIEAASIDGAGIFKTYLKVLFPISLPGFVVVVIWQFTNIWNEFLFAVTVTSDPTKQPITVALVNLAGSQVVEWNVQMAGALLAALPTLIVYILLGKYFLRGLLAGSVKG
ncbi:carbohydrate ABC transporter permease [Mesotoga sp.]|jgi:glucose/mannose transport system permease protein|uniref:ABC-type sugar transport system, permease component n=2 Tax=Mesotoga TaxID=1184396 RepID=A0A101HWR4_9BACT|nr:MAG: ABC-type sugar transport system, permease component [Mesotoga infera]KUK84425.1 MAG: ABC-type sugar transport system, permease component [Mesotoga infera]